MAENIRAKFRCHSVIEQTATEYASLSAVGEDNPTDENERFNQATPDGSLNIMIDNPKAQGFFEEGREYYIDFTPASSEFENELVPA